MPTVLVVDPSSAQCEHLRALLEREQCRVHCRSDPARAVETATALLPDLILLDQFHPEMAGLAALRALRQAPATRKIPVVMLAAPYQGTTRIRALWQGARDYLAKPVATSELLAHVRMLAETPVDEHVALGR